MVFINLPEYREESEDAGDPAGDEKRRPGEPAGDKKRKREEPDGPEESAGESDGESAGESDVIKLLADMINKWLHSDGLPISAKMFGTFKNCAADLEDDGFGYVTVERCRSKAPVIFVYAKIP